MSEVVTSRVFYESENSEEAFALVSLIPFYDRDARGIPPD